jgi:hypothetical protein
MKTHLARDHAPMAKYWTLDAQQEALDECGTDEIMKEIISRAH